MKKLLKNANTAVTCILELIVGILLLVNHDAFVKYLLIIAGAIISVSGVISLIKYFASSPEEGEKSRNLSKALISLTLGVFLIVNNGIAAANEFMNIISLIFGAAILYVGYGKVQNAVDKLRKKQFFLVALISALITVACAIVIFMLKGNALWLFLGISLIAEAVIDLVDIIAGMATGKKAKNNATEEKEEEKKPEENKEAPKAE